MTLEVLLPPSLTSVVATAPKPKGTLVCPVALRRI